MKTLCAMLLTLLLSHNAQAVPLWTEDFSGYSIGDQLDADWVVKGSASQYTIRAEPDWSGTPNALRLSVGAAVWGAVVYQARTFSTAGTGLTMSRRVGKDRATQFWNLDALTLDGATTVHGYGVQYLPQSHSIIFGKDWQGGTGMITTLVSTTYIPNDANDVTLGIVHIGNSIQIYADCTIDGNGQVVGGTLVINTTDSSYSSGYIGFQQFAAGGGATYLSSIQVNDNTSADTPTITATFSGSPTSTHTATATLTPSPSPTSTIAPDTPEYTFTHTPTISQTFTTSPTPTPVNTDTPEVTSTTTGTYTPSPTASPTATTSPTATATWTMTATPFDSPEYTFTATPTRTLSHTVSPTPTPVRTDTPENTFTHTPTPSPTASPSATPSETLTQTATLTPTETQTFTTTPTDIDTATSTTSPTRTTTRTPSHTFSPTITATFTPVCQPFVDGVSSTVGNTTVITWSHNTLATVHSALVVAIAIRGTGTVDNVTYNGVPMTQGVGAGYADAEGEMFYLNNPDPGEHDVVVTLDSDGNTVAAGAVSYGGAGTMTGNTSSTDASAGTSITDFITTGDDYSAVAVLAGQAVPDIAVFADSPMVAYWNQSNGSGAEGVSGMQASFQASTAGSQSYSASFSASGDNFIMGLEVPPFCAVTATNTPTYSFSPTTTPTPSESATDTPTPTESATTSPTSTPLSTPTPGGTLEYFQGSHTAVLGSGHFWTLAPGLAEGSGVLSIVITATHSSGIQPLFSLERFGSLQDGAGYFTWPAVPQKSEYGAALADIRTWPTPETTPGTSQGYIRSDFVTCDGPMAPTCRVYWPFKDDELVVHYGEQLAISSSVDVDNVTVSIRFNRLAE